MVKHTQTIRRLTNFLNVCMTILWGWRLKSSVSRVVIVCFLSFEIKLIYIFVG